MEFPTPIKGIFEGFAPDKIPGEYSPDMNNVRPRDVLENRIRLGQRPGLDKAYAQQIANSNYPVVWLGSITVVD